MSSTTRVLMKHLVLTEEEHRQFDEAENEIDELTNKIRQLDEIHSVTYRVVLLARSYSLHHYSFYSYRIGASLRGEK